MKHMGLKLFSLFLAGVLWYAVRSTSNSSIVGFVVPIEIKNVPASKVVVWPPRREVQVTVKGPSFLVGQIAASPPVMRIRAPEDVSNRFPVSLRAVDLNLPPPVEVTSIEPSEMDIVLDDIETVDIPVRVPRVGLLADTFRLDSIDAEPAMIKLTGPAGELQGIEAVETEAVDLRELSGSAEQRARLRVPGTLTTATPNEVLVRIRITRIKESREFGERLVEVRSAPSGYAWVLEPANVTVRVVGTREELDKVNAEELIPFVRLEPGFLEGQIPVSVELANKELSATAQPGSVQAKRVEKPKASSTPKAKR